MKRLVCWTLLAVSAAAQPGHAANARTATAMQAAIAAGERTIAGKLKYPDTAQFKDMRAYPIKGAHLVVVCGEISGKTDFGRYSRFHLFIAAVRDGKGDPDEAEVYDPTLLSDYPVPKRCQMAASGKTFYQIDP